MVTLVTFGAKHRRDRAVWPRADVYFDCRNFPDPMNQFWFHDGRYSMVQDWLMVALGRSKKLLRLVDDFCNLIRQAADSKSSEPTFALFCHGGRHRSVGIAEILAKALRKEGIRVAVHHEDVDRRSVRGINSRRYLT